MKTKFVLKAKNLNKKWLEAIKSLYGKQQIVITINTEDDEYLDFAAFDTDDDWWETEEDEWDLLNIGNDEEEEKEEVKEAPIVETPVKKTRSPRATKEDAIAEIIPAKKGRSTKAKKEQDAADSKRSSKPRGPYKKTVEKLANSEDKE